jgi:ligand-binding sensor domain-containing protein
MASPFREAVNPALNNKYNAYLLICLAALLLALAPDRMQAQELLEDEPEPPPAGGWLTSGTRFPLDSALEPFLFSPPGTFESFLPARRVYGLASSNDTLWIATEGGLFAYSLDEDSLISVNGPLSPAVHIVTFDDNGSLWTGGRAGASVRREDGWSHYTAGRHAFFENVKDITHGDGRTWLAAYGSGSACIAGDTFTVYTRVDSLLDDRVISVLEETPNTVWFGTASGLCRADTLKWEMMRYGSRIPVGAVEDMIIDEEGNLFLAIMRQGVARYSLGRVRRFRPADGLPSMEMRAFSLDPTGRVWAAGVSGLATFDGSAWVPFRLPGFSFSEYDFFSIHHDLEGTCYLGTDNGSVFVLRRDSVTEIVLPQIFPGRRVAKIEEFNGALWLLTNGSIYSLRESLLEHEPPSARYGLAINDFAFESSGHIWAASRFGILRSDGSSWQVFDRRLGLPTDNFTSVAANGRGQLWFGTFDQGILRYSGSGWIHYTERDGLPGMNIEDIRVDGMGDVWIITASGRIARLDSREWKEVFLPPRADASAQGLQERAYGDSATLHDPAIRFLSGRRGDGDTAPERICIGLDSGGSCLIARSDAIYRLTEEGWQVTESPPAARSYGPSAVLGTSTGDIWLGTRGGGVFIRRAGRWMHVGNANGLADGYILSLSESSGGYVWIGTQFGGLTRFTPDSSGR